MTRLVRRPQPTALALLATAAWADNPAAHVESPTVLVVRTTPLPGIGLPLERCLPTRTAERVEIEVLDHLCKYLNCSLSDLLEYQETENAL